MVSWLLAQSGDARELSGHFQPEKQSEDTREAFLTLQEVGKLRHGEGGRSHPALVAPGCWGPPGRALGWSEVPGATRAPRQEPEKLAPRLPAPRCPRSPWGRHPWVLCWQPLCSARGWERVQEELWGCPGAPDGCWGLAEGLQHGGADEAVPAPAVSPGTAVPLQGTSAQVLGAVQCNNEITITASRTSSLYYFQHWVK